MLIGGRTRRRSGFVPEASYGAGIHIMCTNAVNLRQWTSLFTEKDG